MSPPPPEWSPPPLGSLGWVSGGLVVSGACFSGGLVVSGAWVSGGLVVSGAPPKVPTVAVPEPGLTGTGAGTELGGPPFPEVPLVAVPEPGFGGVVLVVKPLDDPVDVEFVLVPEFEGTGTEIPTVESTCETVF